MPKPRNRPASTVHIRRLAQEADLVNLNPDSILIHIVLQGLSDKTLITKILEQNEGITMQKLEAIVKAQETILTITNDKVGISANDRQDIICWRSGKKGHISPKCKAKTVSCNNCQYKSHNTSV